MIDLENCWYNGLTWQTGLDRRTFQIIRPSAPMAAQDSSLFDYEDAVPPASLIFDRSREQFSHFSSQYALIRNRRRGQSAFERAIGTETHGKWSEFLDRQTPQPDASALPGLFLNWAMLHAPGAAAAGASALAAAVLTNAACEFEGSYNQMRELLSSSAARTVAFVANHTVSTGFPGLWNEGAADSLLSRTFAESRVTVEVAFGGYAVWSSKPGRWYDAELLRSAFHDREWSDWEKFFGANGSLPRVITSLVVADAIDATITSDAVLAGPERTEMESNAHRGLWPLYAPDSGVTTNSVTFGATGGMKIRTVTRRRNPAVIGNHVAGIAQYLEGSNGGFAQAS